MEQITITKEDTVESGWKFSIVVGNGAGAREYTVIVDNTYWKTLTHGAVAPSVLCNP